MSMKRWAGSHSSVACQLRAAAALCFRCSLMPEVRNKLRQPMQRAHLSRQQPLAVLRQGESESHHGASIQLRVVIALQLRPLSEWQTWHIAVLDLQGVCNMGTLTCRAFIWEATTVVGDMKGVGARP